MLPAGAVEHRRDDGELLGWIFPSGDLWQGIDVLGLPVGSPGEWLDVEELLEQRGIGFLADPYTLDTDQGPLRVRLVEVTPDGIVVKSEDFGAIDAPVRRFALSWPAPPELRTPRDDDPNPFVSR